MARSRKIFHRLPLAVWLAMSTAPAWGDIQTGADAYNGGDYALAQHILMPLALHDDPEAQNFVGEMYANGQGVTQNDETAVFWYLHAAENGNSNAQINLGDMYAAGKGVPEDAAIAAYWHWRAAVTFVGAAKSKLNAAVKKTYADASKPPGPEVAKAVNCPPPSYKRDAQHFGEDSTVELMFLVDSNGKAVEASIANSSHWPRLDEAARDAFKACTFIPAKIDGKPVTSVARMYYEWKQK
jgi:TonB family protein